MSTRMLLVRHGQTSYNAERRFMGQLDVPLDEAGRAQAQAVAEYLADERPAVIYASTLGRAWDTAVTIQASIHSHPRLQAESRLIEGHFGEWQGKTFDELRRTDGERLRRWESGEMDSTPPGGESLSDFGSRVLAAYRDMCAAHPNETVLVVAHGGTLQVLIIQALGFPLQDYRKLWLYNAAVSELVIDAGRTVLMRLNDGGRLADTTRSTRADRPRNIP